MRSTTTTLLTATILVISAAAPAVMAAGDEPSLLERNAAILDELTEDVPADQPATVHTEDGVTDTTLDEALDGFAEHATDAGVDLGVLIEDPDAPPTPALAGQGEFPLAGTSGSILEASFGPGPLPSTCSQTVRAHNATSGVLAGLGVPDVFAQEGDGFITTNLSQVANFANALMNDDLTGSLGDSVGGYGATLLAGPNFSYQCIQSSGFLHTLATLIDLSSGVVIDGPIAEQIHAADPLGAAPDAPDAPV